MTCERDDCEREAVEKDGKTLCLTHWIEEIGRHRSTGTMERVRRERKKRKRAESAAFDPAQLSLEVSG